MPSATTVGALAVAEGGANAVGAVRLTLAEKVVEVELVRVAPFAEGFAPGAIVEAVRFTAPYAAIRGLVRRRHVLLLGFDPRVVAPHNRFALTRFGPEPPEGLEAAWRARARARLAALALPAPLGVAVAWAVPSELAGGAVGAGAIALVVAGAALAIGHEIVGFLASGGRASAELGEAFEAELSRRLGLAPPPVRAEGRAPRLAPPPIAAFTAPPSTPPPPPRRVAPPLAADAGSPPAEPSPWRAPIALGLAAAALTVTLALLVHFARTPVPAPVAEGAPASAPAEPAEPSVSAGPATPATTSEPAAPEAPRAGPPCTCARADSPLFREGIPTLAVLVTPHEGSPRKPGKQDLDVAAVNDAARPLRDVRVVLTFSRRAASGKRLGVTDRGLFWSGDLAPGQAVRWRVRAPGTEYRVDASVTGRLGEDPALVPGAPAGAAPPPAAPAAFVPLAAAGLRSVRLHAATMLAYLRDPKALDAARDLGATSAAEALLVARLERASAPVFACGLAAAGDALSMCVMNASTEPAADVVVREVVPEAEGAEVDGGAPAPRAWPIAGVVPVHEGALVTVPLEGRAAPDEVAIARGAP